MNESDKMRGNSGYISEDKKLKDEYNTTGYYDMNVEYIKRLVYKFGYTAVIVNRLDYYANAIPLGAFCNAMSFILYGFYRCGVFKECDSFLWGLILFFGGIGQATAGFFEFLKGRSFPATLYLTYGFYCLSHFATYIIPLKFQKYQIYGINHDPNSLAFFYGAWFLISLPIVICSLKTNIFFLLQTVCTLLCFLFRWIGEIIEKDCTRNKTSGIFEIIAGFVSLYICINQLVNEQFRRQLLPSIPLAVDNEIDIVEEEIQYRTPQ